MEDKSRTRPTSESTAQPPVEGGVRPEAATPAGHAAVTATAPTTGKRRSMSAAATAAIAAGALVGGLVVGGGAVALAQRGDDGPGDARGTYQQGPRDGFGDRQDEGRGGHQHGGDDHGRPGEPRDWPGESQDGSDDRSRDGSDDPSQDQDGGTPRERSERADETPNPGPSALPGAFDDL
ncbi:hypothetical protein [Cellulomonas dongxiuzhuiae]|uniref:hypothetical protein n=1 Tax=Cellulomonas dongxiuzhuiae TaxID=2819979 RepID=UPI001AAF4E84|nr:hypothetical protein [Cellulomonas dongxiuzhuiae]MBO3087757.1 hypothetical protein [Cellulomonas dongxiuzhuiae]